MFRKRGDSLSKPSLLAALAELGAQPRRRPRRPCQLGAQKAPAPCFSGLGGWRSLLTQTERPPPPSVPLSHSPHQLHGAPGPESAGPPCLSISAGQHLWTPNISSGSRLVPQGPAQPQTTCKSLWASRRLRGCLCRLLLCHVRGSCAEMTEQRRAGHVTPGSRTARMGASGTWQGAHPSTP